MKNTNNINNNIKYECIIYSIIQYIICIIILYYIIIIIKLY